MWTRLVRGKIIFNLFYTSITLPRHGLELMQKRNATRSYHFCIRLKNLEFECNSNKRNFQIIINSQELEFKNKVSSRREAFPNEFFGVINVYGEAFILRKYLLSGPN